MKKLFSILSLSLLVALSTEAQEMKPCGLDEIRNKMIADNPSAAFEMDQHEQKMQQATAIHSMAKSTAVPDTIAVVFHILVTPIQIVQMGGIQGIMTRANTQIEALNRDYNADNPDSTGIPVAFKPLYGDAKIHFALAHTTPLGTSTPGYTLDTATVSGYDPQVQGNVGSGYICSNAKYASAGGADAWNATKYLNVWVVNTAPGGTQGGYVAGIAVHPSMTNQIPQAEWGCVIHFLSFGQRKNNSNLNFLPGLDSGRVLVHEVGHYLGLWHVWGNDQGGCSSDDGITDTPPQDVATQSICPSFPLTDACSPNFPGVMFSNYMDYTSEECQHMFSTGQIARIKSSITQTYPQLVQNAHLTAYPTSTGSATVQTPEFTISPNPSRNTAYINVAGSKSDLKKITVINSVGQVMNAIQPENGRDIYMLDVQSYPSGIYYIQCQYTTGAETQKLMVN